MAFVETGLPCPKCDSSDALAIGENGWGKCFSCDSNIPPNTTNNESITTSKTTKATPMDLLNKKAPLDLKLQFTDIADRKISAKTAKVYGVGYNKGDLYFPLNDGKAYKVREDGQKKFKIVGDFKEATNLFGQERFSKGGKFVVVTEGELDALAMHQVMSHKTPVVSIRNGTSAALKDCKSNYEYLDSFDDVIFFFDNDDAGKEAQEKCAELFSHKAKVIRGLNGFKDACDYLIGNRTLDLVNLFWRAERWTPDGIINGASLYDEVMKPLQKSDCDYPFEGLNKLTYGIRKGELITVCAGSGLGKSQFLREVVYGILGTTDDNVGLMFLEESTSKTALSLMSLAANKPLHLPDCVTTQEEKDEAFKATLGTNRLFLFDHFGSTDIDNIISRIRYLSKATDCKYIFLDHLSIIVSAQSNGDERKALDEIMTKMRMLVQETNISLVLVSHLKRPEKKGHEEGAASSLSQLRGSASIAQLSDMVIGLERNAQADDPIVRNTTIVRVLKNRFAGITGKACALLYSLTTGRMTEYEEEEAL